MPSIETYRKQAKLLVRWHRERNYSIGEKLRLLERYRHLTDVEVLEMAMPLTLAQEIVAVEAGFEIGLRSRRGLATSRSLRASIPAGRPWLARSRYCSCATLRRQRSSTRGNSASTLIFFTESRPFTVQCRAIGRAFTCGSSIRPTSPNSPRAKPR